uniref:Uncharacterized protein n=1 Tax=Triticum urartu TaxID=4572 RepID=A0A8R7TP24_TRIUA
MIYWFDVPPFYTMVKPVLKKPGGVLTVWGTTSTSTRLEGGSRSGSTQPLARTLTQGLGWPWTCTASCHSHSNPSAWAETGSQPTWTDDRHELAVLIKGQLTPLVDVRANDHIGLLLKFAPKLVDVQVVPPHCKDTAGLPEDALDHGVEHWDVQPVDRSRRCNEVQQTLTADKGDDLVLGEILRHVKVPHLGVHGGVPKLGPAHVWGQHAVVLSDAHGGLPTGGFYSTIYYFQEGVVLNKINH